MRSDVNLNIFETVFKKRPEIILEKFKIDLERYYLPFTQKLVDLKNKKSDDSGSIIGVSAIQGSGKTTQGEVLEILLKSFGFNSVSLSIDDHYLTHQQLSTLRKTDPRFIRRGVTHDTLLALRDLKSLKSMKNGEIRLICGYDKGAYEGDGERFRWINPVSSLEVKVSMTLAKDLVFGLQTAKFEETKLNLSGISGTDVRIDQSILKTQEREFFVKNSGGELLVSLRENGQLQFKGSGEIEVDPNLFPKGWRLVNQKPDFIFYDGWMLGARKADDASVFRSGLPALEKVEDQNFAMMINEKLTIYYDLWDMIEFLNVLYVPNYQISLKWREEAEKPLREKGEGMTTDQIREFVHYFWRSVHPAIQIRNLAMDSEHTQQVAIIGDDHSIIEVITPGQVREKLGFG